MSPKNCYTMKKLLLATAPMAVQGLNLSYTFGLKKRGDVYEVTEAGNKKVKRNKEHLGELVPLSQSFHKSLKNLELPSSLSKTTGVVQETKNKIFAIVQDLANTNRCIPGEILGRGSFGVVVSCAAKESSGPRVAKVPFYCDSESKKESEREGAIHARLSEQQKQHKVHYVPERFGSFTTRDCPVEIMERGTPVTNLDIRLNPYQFLEEAAESLLFLHEHNIVHMDFKSSNTVKLPNGRFGLIDFGYSEYTGGMLEGERGTPIYIAPELYKSQFQISGKIDVYALGIEMVVSLYLSIFPSTEEEMTGVFEQLRSLANDQSTSRSERDLLQLLMRMIEKDAERRPSAREVVKTLRDFGRIDNFVKTQQMIGVNEI